jgi:hypothetical protein
MLITLLCITFGAAFLTCAILSQVFKKPVKQILNRLINEDISVAWAKYMTFAIFVTGISGGVRVWELERYVFPQGEDKVIMELTGERLFLELYRTIIGTLQSVAWMLLVFFVVALVAFVIVKGRELKHEHNG